MIEYAIVPPITTIIAWMFFQLFLIKRNWVIIFPILIVILAMIGMLITVLTREKIVIENDTKNKIFSKELIITLVSITFSLIILTISVLTILLLKTDKEIYKLLIFIVSSVAFLIILMRWTWGPIAFIRFYNRLHPKADPKQIQQWYFFYMAPIILKGSITIPLYSFTLMPLIPLLIKLNYKHNKLFLKY